VVARARSLRLAHAWRLILAGVLLAVIVVGLELALLVWLRFDPFQVTPTPSTGVDDHTADEVFLGFMRLELLLLASAGLSVSLPWLIARRRLRRQLRERPEAKRIGDDELSRLPAGPGVRPRDPNPARRDRASAQPLGGTLDHGWDSARA
jgi:hypothetical protein